MKKIISLLAVSVILSSCSIPAIADVERGYISVNTSANAEITPDIAEVSIAIITYDNKSMQKATVQNKEISDKVISTLKSMINTSNGDYIKTANYSASPQYIYKDNKRILDKYQVSNSVIVHTKSIDKVGSMIDKSISLGATNVNSLNFSVSNTDKQCNDLITKASKQAKERVDAALKPTTSAVTGIKSMDISCSTNNSVRPQYRLMKSNMVMSAGAADAEVQESSTIIEQGVVKIYANVNAQYFVK
ncbi:SIMPL domain-containing protein [bacterium]|nr:SIMPL domain-containing protein [bacterium]